SPSRDGEYVVAQLFSLAVSFITLLHRRRI
uniref:Stress-associated endoplasmic reticulum protein 2 n=1 Tax=Parascaris univalens TaxID=6257 RepID=A0A915CLG3_PARUN